MAVSYDWARVRKAVARSPGWYLLGRNLPRSIAESIRGGMNTTMAGVQVSQRNTSVINGRRHCDIWLKIEEEA